MPRGRVPYVLIIASTDYSNAYGARLAASFGIIVCDVALNRKSMISTVRYIDR
ncbi:MAG: hypothetical protein ACXV2E_09280 [Halobacteriota archaeon]